MGVYVECVVMTERIRRAMGLGEEKPDVFVVRMADVCDCVDSRMVRPRCSSPVRMDMWRQSGLWWSWEQL
jgi:hypothetical protein